MNISVLLTLAIGVYSTLCFAEDQTATYSKIEDRYQLMGVILDQSKDKNAVGIVVIQDKSNSKTAILKKGDKFPFESFGKSFFITDVTKESIVLSDFQEEIILRHPNGRRLEQPLTVNSGTIHSDARPLVAEDDNDQDQFIDHEFINNYWEAQAALIAGEEDEDENLEEETIDNLRFSPKSDLPIKPERLFETDEESSSTVLDDQQYELIPSENNDEDQVIAISKDTIDPNRAE